MYLQVTKNRKFYLRGKRFLKTLQVPWHLTCVNEPALKVCQYLDGTAHWPLQ